MASERKRAPALPACPVCQRPAVFTCARCAAQFYCSAGCQKRHWPLHRRACPHRALPTPAVRVTDAQLARCRRDVLRKLGSAAFVGLEYHETLHRLHVTDTRAVWLADHNRFAPRVTERVDSQAYRIAAHGTVYRVEVRQLVLPLELPQTPQVLGGLLGLRLAGRPMVAFTRLAGVTARGVPALHARRPQRLCRGCDRPEGCRCAQAHGEVCACGHVWYCSPACRQADHARHAQAGCRALLKPFKSRAAAQALLAAAAASSLHARAAAALDPQ